MLGSHLLVDLRRIGHEVLAPSRQELDLCNYEKLQFFLKSNQFDLVIHTAALVGGIKTNLQRVSDFLTHNLQIDSNLLRACQEQNIGKFLYTSSSCTYPVDTPQPLSETHLTFGEFEKTNRSYAIAKMTAVEAIKAINIQYQLHYRALVLSNLYGPHDHFFSDKSHLIAAAITKCKEAIESGKNEVDVWGSGNPRREFTYVGDVSSWIAEIAVDTESLPETLNIGYGKDYSVREYYQFAGTALGYEGTFTYNKAMPDGVPSKLMNSGIAREYYDWNPTTGVQEGIKRSIDWLRKREGNLK